MTNRSHAGAPTAATTPPPRSGSRALANWSLFWFLFIGVGAIGGTAMMWCAPEPTGMTDLLPQIQQDLPLIGASFHSFLWPGLLLLAIIGVPNLVGATLTMKRSPSAALLAFACGVILMGWTGLQLLVVFGVNPISAIYFVFGLLQAVLGFLWLRSPDQHKRL